MAINVYIRLMTVACKEREKQTNLDSKEVWMYFF
jgi:hypothetical protein